MKKSAMQNIRGTEMYRNIGFVPADKMGESVTITQEYAFDDWCILQVAKKLKKYEDTAAFTKRAGYWKNVFDAGSGFFRGKNLNGKWVKNFDPFESIQVPVVHIQKEMHGNIAFLCLMILKGLRNSLSDA